MPSPDFFQSFPRYADAVISDVGGAADAVEAAGDIVTGTENLTKNYEPS